jgi:two-component system response regulator (stage 0 sporulation protein F)
MSGPVFPPAAQRPRSFIILIVAENADFGRFLEEVINAQTPYQAVVVASGLCALEQARHLRPCLFLLDYHLSDMNGLEVFDRLQQMEETRGTPAIMMSADLPYEALERRGIYPLRRPTDRRRVVRVITHALASDEEQQLARSQQIAVARPEEAGQGPSRQSLARARSS